MRFGVAYPSQHDHSRTACSCEKFAKEIQPALASHIKIKQDDFWLLAGSDRQCISSTPRLANYSHSTMILDKHAQPRADDHVIVDQQNFDGFSYQFRHSKVLFFTKRDFNNHRCSHVPEELNVSFTP